ncbi:hypothetical protein tinsulaeT_26170 [Thalassotalea insulae]|uniref:DUF922 domain-containing protein n=1 Tax=Thalassotalea insulae TaxID=2056778 RepID=A0ABQ6GXD3_9GAMM|nr:DUF922 domain-containing protein [Thalassotalea insulae]GLX79277.1 hypothetical protein tinsulaeT_26170 [Thalassotalea insulae]
MKSLLIFICLFANCQLAYAEIEIGKELDITYYQVSGKNIEELRQSVKENGPSMATGKKLWAKAAWEIVTEYHFKTLESGCLISVSSMKVVADVSLPQWRDVDSLSTKTKEWWQEFSEFMYQHENLHVDNVINEAKALKQAITKQQPLPSCELARNKYFFLKREYLAEINFNDVKIDRAAMQRFNSNERLFEPLKASGGLVIESGGMRSIISL